MFDLNSAIAGWKRAMQKYPSIEENDLAELERYLRDKIDDLVGAGLEPEAAFRRVEAEFVNASGLDAAYGHARAARPGRRFPWRPARFSAALLWSHIRFSFRRMVRQKMFSLINIGGLALGVAAGLFALIFVGDEISFDRFHAKADRIYRLAQNIHIENRVDSALPTPPILASALAAEFPEIELTARVAQRGGIVKRDDLRFTSRGIYAVDADFFKVFSFPLLAGDPQTALSKPNQVILTRSSARRCFGAADPMGRTLTIEGLPFTVTGLAEDCPRNSHFHFEFLTSIPTYPRSRSTGWFDGFCATYVVLKKEASPQVLEAKLRGFVRAHYFAKGRDGLFKDWVYFLQPLTSIHLHSNLLIGEFEANSSAVYARVFLFVAAMILLIAGLNFVNLSTARFALRRREIGVRKVFGSRRSQLVRQFLVESVLTTLAAFAVALVLILVLLPAFRSMTGKDIDIGDLARPGVAFFIFLLALVIGLGSGLYPGLVLSSFRPSVVLGGARSGTGTSRGPALRKILLVFQFSLSIFLLAGTAVVYKQMGYFQSKRLGFDREHVLVVKNAPLLGKQVRAFKDKLLQIPQIERVSLASALPGEDPSDLNLSAVRAEGIQGDLVLEMGACDEDFLETLKLEMTEGRFFSNAFPSDERAILINEETVRGLGWDHPVGKHIRVGRDDLQVIGVLKDFHVRSLHSKIPRMGWTFTGRTREANGNYFAVRVRPADLREVLARVREAWDAFSPALPLDYSFLDQDYAVLYAAEVRTMKVLSVFSVLAVVLSCLGLFGLTVFQTEQRKKEIGIRKVLGAGDGEIVALFGRDFLKGICAAHLIAWPVAFITAGRWLEKFAYRIELGVGPFLLSAAAVLMVAGTVVIGLTWRAARANPADTIRTE